MPAPNWTCWATASYVQDIEQIVRGMAGTSPLTVVNFRRPTAARYRKTAGKNHPAPTA